jgi:hypothetical protein
MVLTVSHQKHRYQGCKRDVAWRDRDETETSKLQDRDETETSVSRDRDVGKNVSRRPRPRRSGLETETSDETFG